MDYALARMLLRLLNYRKVQKKTQPSAGPAPSPKLFAELNEVLV